MRPSRSLRTTLLSMAALAFCVQDPASGRAATPSPAIAVSPPAREVDPPEARALRRRLVERLRATLPLHDPRVLEVMASVPRHRFVEAPLEAAYLDRPLPIGYAQTISQPLIVAMMTDALELHGTERVLEIGTGSGYQAAVLSRLCAQVYSIELLRPLGEAARERLERLGYRNVQVRIGDGYLGWPEEAPFERIMLTAAPPQLPQALIDQLSDGGVLVAPVGPEGEQHLERWRKVGGRLPVEELGPVSFVPMVH